jgi:chromosome partitioning protein
MESDMTDHPTPAPLAEELHNLISRRDTLNKAQWPLPSRPRIFTVSNQKGGVGKTTTAVNLAAVLSQRGAQVLVIDLDPQGNASTALGVNHQAHIPGTYEVLIGSHTIASVVQKSSDNPRLSCVPATINLAGAEIELVSMDSREFRLRQALTDFLGTPDGSGFHYVFIDCPPSLGLLTLNAFVGASEVLIPIQCEYYALEGLSQLLGTIDMIRDNLNPRLTVSTILLTMFDQRTNLAQQVAEDVQKHFPDVVLNTLVPRSVRVSEAPSFGQTVVAYDPGSPGAIAYSEAALEIAHRGGTV